jgi:hypothetical protein
VKSSVGGNVSADKGKAGNGEVTVEGHVSTKSDDGNTSFSAGGKVSVDTQGNVAGEVTVGIEHEF